MSTATNVLAANADLLAAATAAGQRFHLGITLSYVGGGSDKFWTGVWADTQVAVNFGAHYTNGQYKLHRLDSVEKAAAKMWALLREKVGKGYTVVDAAFLTIDPADRNRRYDDEAAREMVARWTSLRTNRALNPVWLPYEPDADRSPRTGKQGGQVLLAISDPHADHDTLIAAYDSAPSERFLPPLVLSHPACPEEARFLSALAGTRVL